MSSTVVTAIENNIAIIKLNRQDKLNSFNREMCFALQDALKEVNKNKDVRVVVITGEGKGFCAGQDLAEVIDPNGPKMSEILPEQLNPIIEKIREMKKPIIAAVNGVAAGAGANIAIACDIVVASSNASFIQAFSKIGLIPDSGGTFFLPRLIGWQKASALMMLGEKVSAQEAERIGMIYKYFDAENFMNEVMKIATQMSLMPTKAFYYTRQALNASLENTLEEQLKEEDRLQQKAADTFDFKEGVEAFVQKRQPNFKGE
jgi:2-(1,2-epoxy-1,2-dihydrophenyl)acetyl-CoA isomerase